MPVALTTLDRLVDGFVARGDAPAIVTFRRGGAETIAYGELAERIRAAASGLHVLGLGPGDLVLLWAPNSPEWVEAYLAIVCAGAAAIPLDRQCTVETARAVIEHAGPKLLVMGAEQREALATVGALEGLDYRLLDPDAPATWSWRNLRRPPGEPVAIEPGSLASLVFTSGTTGAPKGVPLTHGNLAANTSALVAAGLITPRDRVLVPLPLHHTYPSTVGMLMVLGTGAAMVLPAGISGPEMSGAIKDARATALLAVPRLCVALWSTVEAGVRGRGPLQARLFAALLQVSIAVRRVTGVRLGKLLFSAVHTRVGRDLDLIGSGGAKLDEELEWKLEGLGWRVLTGYGLTETSPVLTFNRPGASRLGSEGRPLAGVELRIEPQPGQGPGEILARGPSVFSGYWRDADATREAFTQDGWFRTGDLGRLDQKGFLRISGRSDEVIVLPDGKKVFPEEIEKAYLQSALFRDFGVLEDDGRLVALIVPDEAELRRRGALRAGTLLRDELEGVSRWLPPYERVSAYRTTEQPLPRTEIGKLQRHLLPGLYRQSAAAASGRAPAALSEEDRRLLSQGITAEVWRWLVRRFPDYPLTLDTSPQLDLQIDSLEWVSITFELQERFGVALDAEAVSRVVTLRDLLCEVERARPAEAAPGEGPASHIAPPGPLLDAAGASLFLQVRVLMRTLFRLRVAGVERLGVDGPLVFVPNHASFLDPLAVAAAMPWRELRKTYWAGWVGVMYADPVRRFVSRATRVFPVDPDRDLAGAIRAARAVLENGNDLVWFPEGRRSPNGALQPFQGGIGVLLEDSSAHVVPTAIRGTFAAWPRDRRLPRLRPITVTFGDPLPVASLAADGRGETAAERIRSGLEREVASLLADDGAPTGIIPASPGLR